MYKLRKTADCATHEDDETGQVQAVCVRCKQVCFVVHDSIDHAFGRECFTESSCCGAPVGKIQDLENDDE